MRLVLFLLALLAPATALSQSAVLQGGPWTSGHAPMYSTPGGGAPVVQDSGPAGGGSYGVGLSEFLQVNRGSGTPPFANTGTGPLNTHGCLYDGPITSAFHYLCLDANAQGGGLIAYGAGGGGALLPLTFNINGITWSPTGGIGTVPTTALSGVLQAAQFPALTGDVTTSAGALATTIANNAVTNAKAAQMATNTVKGNATSGTANASDLSVASCSTNGSALKWTTNTGFGCNTTIDAATLLTGTWAIPGTIGSTTPNTGAFSFLTENKAISGTLSAATAFQTPLLAQILIPSDNGAVTTTPGQHIPTAFDVEHTYGGSAINDGRNAISGYLQMTSATNASNAYPYYSAGYFFGDVNANDNGTVPQSRGNMNGISTAVRLKAPATHWTAAIGLESNIDVETGADTYIKAGLAVIPWPADAVSGFQVDGAIWLSASAGGIGWNHGIFLDNTAGLFPIKSTGDIIKSSGGTIANGMDVSATTVTGCSFKSTGFCVDGSGNVTTLAHYSTAALPAISTCGTSPPAATAGSNSMAGQFTTGTGAPTACTVTFAVAYPTSAFCTISPASSGGAAITGGYYISAQSRSAFTVTLGTGTSSVKFNYACGGN